MNQRRKGLSSDQVLVVCLSEGLQRLETQKGTPREKEMEVRGKKNKSNYVPYGWDKPDRKMYSHLS